MIYEMPLPSLGADMDEARFIEWRVKVGDVVQKGQVVAVIETTKAAVEIESFHAGQILELLVQPEDMVAVGKTIAKLDVQGTKTETAPGVTGASTAPRLRISPAARRFAQENGMDLTSSSILSLKGSGPEGALELKDLQGLQKSSGAKDIPVVKNVAEKGIQNIRQAIAKAMTRSKATIPHYYLKLEANIDGLIQTLDQKNAQLVPAERWMFPAAVAYLVTQALKKNSQFNGYYVDEEFRQSTSINIGLAVSLKTGGVVVPALLQSEAMTFTQFNAAFKDLIQRSREARLKNSELTEGTVTVTNLGDLGADEVQGIIFPPQVALVGVGRRRTVPQLVNQTVVLQNVLNLSLSGDHRVTDGISGSKFLREIAQLMMNSEKYLI